MGHYHSVSWKPAELGRDRKAYTRPFLLVTSQPGFQRKVVRSRTGNQGSWLQPGVALAYLPGWVQESRAGEEKTFSHSDLGPVVILGP